jgi:hypothetical protein
MLGASLSLGVIVRGGVTPLAMTAVIITGMLTGISMMLFQVLRRGQAPKARAVGGAHSR